MNTETIQRRKWWSKAILIGGMTALVAAVVGAVGTKFGMWGFQSGIVFLLLGMLLALVVLVLGLIAIIVSARRGSSADRNASAIGVVLAGSLVGLMLPQLLTARSVPPIHNISTDMANPPKFDKIVQLRGEDSNPLEYDAVELSPLQAKHYPDVKPLNLSEPPNAVFDKAVQALTDMGLEVVSANSETHTVEATETTFWFGFKDDVVVRITPSETGSVVDVRSVSRVGRSDLGANAKRIHELLKRLGG